MASPPFRPADNPQYTPPHSGATRNLRPMPVFPTDQWAMPDPIYGALMGLLASTGCLFGTRGD